MLIFLLILGLSESNKLAVCAVGVISGRVDNSSINSITMNFLRPLAINATIDMFVILPQSETGTKEFALLDEWKSVAGLSLYPSFVQEEKLHVLLSEISNEDKTLLHAVDQGAFCGSNLWQAFYRERCFEQISINQPYDWYISTRLDYFWLSEHVPLTFLGDRLAGYVPDGEDYGGLNDRHFVTRNFQVFQIYMTMWSHVKLGSAAALVRSLEGNQIKWGVHEYLLLRLGFAGVSIERIPSVAYLLCLSGIGSVSPTLFNNHSESESFDICPKNHREFFKNYACIQHSKVPGLGRAKYLEEWAIAVNTALCLKDGRFSMSGGQWTTASFENCYLRSHRSDSFAGNVFDR